MHIIFGQQEARNLSEKYTVLEVDAFRFEPNGEVVPAYCVIDIDSIPVQEITQNQQYQDIHSALIEHYRKKEWSFCLDLINLLRGRWKGTMDSFYDILQERVVGYQKNPPGNDWDPVLNKFSA